MPAPYRDKNILEMSDREREARRIDALMRPGRDAVEGVYPEEFIVPGAASLMKRIKGIGTARQANTQKAIKDIPIPPEKRANPWANVSTENNNTPLKILRDEESLQDKQQALRALDKAINKSNVRSVAENAGKFIPSDSKEEYKRGGAVKTKSHRGDGIAQRGKTKGRFV